MINLQTTIKGIMIFASLVSYQSSIIKKDSIYFDSGNTPVTRPRPSFRLMRAVLEPFESRKLILKYVMPSDPLNSIVLLIDDISIRSFDPFVLKEKFPSFFHDIRPPAKVPLPSEFNLINPFSVANFLAVRLFTSIFSALTSGFPFSH